MSDLRVCQRVVLGLLILAMCSVVLANPVDTGYREPAQAIIDIVDAPPAPGVSAGPDPSTLLLMDFPALPRLRDLAAPELRLAGRRINPDNNGPSQPRYVAGLRLLDTESGDVREVTGLPENARILTASYSPDGRYLAVLHAGQQAVELWRVDIAEATAKRWSDVEANAAWGNASLHWRPDGKGVVLLAVGSGRGEPPEASPVPDGPVVTEVRGRVAPSRTYQDLLGNRHDEALFEYYFSSRVEMIGLDGQRQRLGESALYYDVNLSPDGEHLLVTQLRKPWSYAVPHFRFARTVDVWNLDGERLYRVVDQPVADDLPIAFDAVVPGRRSVSWREDADATLLWAEAADGGDPRIEAEIRDRVFQLASPFSAEPSLLAELATRYVWFVAGDDDHAMLWERWWDTREESVWHVSPGRSDPQPSRLWQRSWEDRYADPGTPMTRTDERGRQRLWLEDGQVFLRGQGASEEGDRPFLDRMDLASGESERLWRSQAPWYEQLVAMLDSSGPRVLLQREQEDQPADIYRLNLAAGADLLRLTETPHPMPHVRDISREMIEYQRADGVSMQATLYLPAGYDAEVDGPLPTLIWAYPREFRSADAAGQVSDSPYRFSRISYWRPQFLAALGYAVLDNATMPVIGEGDDEPNDSFIEQLVMNAEAAIEAGVSRGVTDRNRVALGGHSYGAFMTANVLAHSDLFQAGIARSGAFNRTLTPFGFQREQRTIWDDTDLYIRMSPFFHADGIQAPLLLIHGSEDNNSGTFPMQSERFYQAIKGLGGTSRLVMLPLESHGYRARESVLHMLWETIEWMDEFVRNAEVEED